VLGERICRKKTIMKKSIPIPVVVAIILVILVAAWGMLMHYTELKPVKPMSMEESKRMMQQMNSKSGTDSKTQLQDNPSAPPTR
jgi:flagellar basal body-associated protein FliL